MSIEDYDGGEGHDGTFPYAPDPYEFTSETYFEVKGRGRVFAIERNSLPPDVYDPDDLKGLVVKLNGSLVKVIGVESYKIWRGPEKPYTLGFGLMIEELS